ncbi:acyl-CoA dehydrogenase family protein [Maricaulis parjimensis]|uniref:acyl-CoA dehydrogenase family protein n=1 Tax=Maricaulis parjimensis TaxID=144023 RepID=UPI00193A647E|nr:acyl-CoA dehydrogenase family protein [Maricaulis parjimensis]
MDFNLTEVQSMLRDTMARYLRETCDFETRRALIAEERLFRPEVWTALAEEIGVLGAAIPEAQGGFDGGAVETMVVMEEVGRSLMPEPYLDCAVMAPAILKSVSHEAGAELLEGIAAGQARPVLAWQEAGVRAKPDATQLTARQSAPGWVLEGEKILVSAGAFATHFLVTAKTDNESGLLLFLVPAGIAGLERSDYRTIDDRPASDLVFGGVELPQSACLAGPGDAADAVGLALDEAAAAVSAEAVGIMRALVAGTVDYLKQRKQFGIPISNFQVLQHRLVDMNMEVEQASAAVVLAAVKMDAEPTERRRAVSACKATVDRAARIVGEGAVQLHGAMGMTEELIVGHYFKRLTAITQSFGDRAYHSRRYMAARAEAGAEVARPRQSAAG